MRNWIVGLAALAFANSAWAFGSTTVRLKMGDTHESVAKLTGMEGDPLAKEPVEYEESGNGKYDDFFRKAAVLRAGLVVSNEFANVLTKNIKAFARSSMAADEIAKSQENLTDEKALAVLKAQKSKITADQLKFLASAGANTAQLIVYLNESAKAAPALAQTGKDLTQSVKSDFTGFSAMKAPGVTAGLGKSVDNVNSAAQSIPDLVKTLTRLSQGIAAING
jgi:hypothetical protein